MALGSVARGSRRAIDLPFFSFQASELGKVLLVVALSALRRRPRRGGCSDRDTTARIMLLALIPAALVMVQPDLGSGLVYIVIALAVLFVAGTPLAALRRARRARRGRRSRSCSSPRRRPA